MEINFSNGSESGNHKRKNDVDYEKKNINFYIIKIWQGQNDNDIFRNNLKLILLQSSDIPKIV